MTAAVLAPTYPLTPLQEGMLFHSRLAPGAGVYVQQMVVTLPEAVDADALRQAWQFVAQRHAVLRTAFPDEPGQTVYPVSAGGLALHAVVGAAAEGKALKKGLDELRKAKKNRPPLFGLMHYERCRLVLQPLATFDKAGPDYLTISKENVNKAALLKAMSFT